MLEENAVQELVDPRLGDRYSEQEASFMLAAASLCLRRDPHSRPRMAQVIIILHSISVIVIIDSSVWLWRAGA